MAAVIPTPGNNQRLEGCTVTHKAPVTRGSGYVGVFFTHPSFEGIELHVALRFALVTAEGDPTQFFAPTDVPVLPPIAANDAAVAGDNEDPASSNPTNRREDIQLLRNQGYDVDDDNEPAPENIPDDLAPAPGEEGLYPGQRWGVNSHVDPMLRDGYSKPPTLNNNFDIKNATYFDLFKVFFPWQWLCNVLLVQTNRRLQRPLTLGELIRYIGIWFRMATVGTSHIQIHKTI